MKEPASTTETIIPAFAGTLNAIAKQEADAKQVARDARASGVRGIVAPRIDEARALIADIEAAQTEAAPVVEPLVGIDWNALRRHVPITIHGDSDTRTTVTMLERAVRGARELMRAHNATTLRGTVARIEQLLQFDGLTMPEGLLGLLQYEIDGSKELPASLRQQTRAVVRFTSQLHDDISSGKGIAQEPTPPVEQIMIPVLPTLNEPAERAIIEFDPMAYAQQMQPQPKDGITAGPFFKVRAPKERRG